MNLFKKHKTEPKEPGDLLKRLPALAREQEAYIIGCRRQFHRQPETGGREKKTSAFIRQEAEKLGLPVEEVSTTGLLVTLDTGRPGSSVALRADIDALPIQESPDNAKGPRAVISENPGVAHLCGHDAHTGMLLGAMQVLNKVKSELCGKIYFCFEEGEETGTGFGGMVDALQKRNVNTVFGLHVASELEHGQVSVVSGARMAGTQEIDVTFIGRGGHGSRPDLSINPVYTAAAAVCELAIAFANQIDPNDPVTLGITSITGGNAANVFPDTARVRGSMRFFSAEAGKRALNIVKKVFEKTAEMHNCQVDFGAQMSVFLLPVVNDEDAVRVAKAAFTKALPDARLATLERSFGSETFSHYLASFKGVFAHLGIRNEELGVTAGYHNEHFDVDESALVTGTVCHCAYAIAATTDPEIAAWTWREAPVTAYDEEEDDEAGASSTDASRTAGEPGLTGYASGAAAAGTAGRPKYSVDTKIKVLMKSEAAKAAIEAVVPGVVTHPQIGFVKGMSIRKAAELAPEMITAETLSKLDAALAAVEE
ncbi:MAG: amidohydrolase [Clostridia bacterium]|nr:amidohydrolase [Clostridia bacterium]